jgi:pectate lyase
VRNQEIEASMSIDAVSSLATAWVGLYGRYVNANTHYYVTLRTNNRVEIRKKVDGVSTLLASANYPVAVGGFGYQVRFRLLEDKLELFINDKLVARARDSSIAAGQHGLVTYRAAAGWSYVYVSQP